MQIICCGNADRGDGSVALLVAQKLRDMGMEVEIHSGDVLALIESWDETEEVIVVDATVTGTPLGTVQVWDAPLPEEFVTAATSTHGLGVGEAIYLAQILNRLPKRLRIYGIEGKKFSPGDHLSPEVEEAAIKVARQIVEEAVVSSH